MRDPTNAIPLSIDASDEDAVVCRVSQLLERDRNVQASSAVQQALRRYPDNQTLVYFASVVEYRQRRYREAKATLGQLLQLAPTHYGGRWLLAKLQETDKDFAAAQRTWAALLRDRPNDPSVLGQYAHSMLLTNFTGKARELAQQGLQLQPDHPLCLFVLVRCELLEGQKLKDERSLAKLLTHHPESIAAAEALMSVLETRGRNREALAVAQGLFRARPDSPEFLKYVRHFRMKTHWTMLPMTPLFRWRTASLLVVWCAFWVSFALRPFWPSPVITFSFYMPLGIVVYLVIWPHVLRRWV